MQCKGDKPHEPSHILSSHLYSVTMFTCNLFELLFVKQHVKRKKEHPNSLPKNKSTTMMLTVHFVSTLKG